MSANPSQLRFGYNTNGLAHHAPEDAVALLSELGYTDIGLTLDHGWLNPYATDFPLQLDAWKRRLRRHGFGCVVETGARFLLDPRRKHEPTLLTPDDAERARRVEFYRRAIDVAAELNADCVSLWSGVAHERADDETHWERLLSGLLTVLDYAVRRGVAIGFEPEPGMFIDTMTKFDELLRRIDHPALRLTLDVGHLHCQGETPIAEVIERYASRVVNVHIEDMRAGVHEHLRFGEGEMDFAPILAALRRVGYSNGVYVELSRHSHCAPEAAAEAITFLKTRS
ncbi:MAG: sugar phosphate isomerase/epimerase family protein [Pirellulales bacterium]